MATVNTIAGPIESAELGQTLSHEHLTSGMGGMERLPGLHDEEEGGRRCLAPAERGARGPRRSRWSHGRPGRTPWICG